MKRIAVGVHAASSWALVVATGLWFVSRAASYTNVTGALEPLLGVCSLAVVVSGAVAGLGRLHTVAAFGLLVLYFVYSALGGQAQPMVALVLFGLALAYAAVLGEIDRRAPRVQAHNAREGRLA